MIWLAVLLVPMCLLVAGFQYLGWYHRWERRNTGGMAYYSRSLAERRSLKEQIRRYSSPVKPFVRLLALGLQRQAAMPGFDYEGVCGPPTVSSPGVFEIAKNYRPRPNDVFIATQMRCGTTWMQQLVYEIIHRGHGNLSDNGHGHLYAVSPWIDGVNSVSLEDAPLLGETRTRIIKTHLPTQLCPYNEEAKYIYVTRHPVSCFASIVDYNRTLLGPLMPEITKMIDWFCSDRMYWSPWPKHVEGWWQWSQMRKNVLFVHYEEMTRNFGIVLDQVARFLGYQLTGGEIERITEKCSLKYMKDNEDLFEMAPPTMFSVDGGQFLATGKASRYKDLTPAIRQAILNYCRLALVGSTYPAAQYYPDLVTPSGVGSIEQIRANNQRESFPLPKSQI